MKSILSITVFVLLFSFPAIVSGQCDGGDGVYIGKNHVKPEGLTHLTGDLIHYGKVASDINDRAILFFPGLGGDYNAWRDVRDETADNINDEYPSYPARRAAPIAIGEEEGPGYSEDAGLHSAALDLYYNKLNSINYDSLGITNIRDNIVIAHSQGGLVARALDRAMHTAGRSPQFGGLVTFGSPHQGAEILTNGLPVDKGGRGMIPKLSYEMINDLSAGPIWQELKYNRSFLFKMIRLFNLEDEIEDLTKELNDVISNTILPRFILPSYSPQITRDYFAHNEYYSKPNYLLNELNNYQTSIPMVAFYGIEEEPVVWRQLGSAADGVHTFPAFQSDPDQDYVDAAADIRADYWSKYMSYKELEAYHNSIKENYWQWRYLVLPVIGWTDHMLKTGKARKVKNAFKEGCDFLYEVNDKWKTIIGARKTKQIITQTIVCRCSDKCNGGWDSEFTVNDHIECLERDLDDKCLECSPATYSKVVTVPTYKESDGVVLAESARGLPGAIVNPNLSDDDYKLKNTNHQQLRNSSETARKLNRLFNTNDYSSFFITPVR